MRPVRHAAAAAVVAAAGLIGGCVPASRYHEPRPSHAAADAPGVEATAAALAGDWTGEYDAPLHGRRGRLQLSLRRVAPAGARTASTVTGTVTPGGSAPVAVDSARVGRGRVVLWLAPFADTTTGATVWLRLDGALAADTLGGRLQGTAAATAAAERRGGWRLVRDRPTTDARS